MGVKPDFNMAAIKTRMLNFLSVVEDKQIELLQYMGEQAVRVARDLDPSIGFHDRTGMLRSSIGYAIYKDGVMLTSEFDPVKANSPKYDSKLAAEGQVQGLNLANKVATDLGKKGLSLVITAGANYAAALQAGGAWKIASKRNYDVLISAQNYVEKELPGKIKELATEIIEAAK